MKQHYSAIDKAFLALYLELETQAVIATVKMSKSKKNKNKNCGFVCAMGQWFWFIEDDSEITPAANKSWQKAFDTYQFNFMVRSLKIVCLNGKIIERTRNW